MPRSRMPQWAAPHLARVEGQLPLPLLASPPPPPRDTQHGQGSRRSHHAAHNSPHDGPSAAATATGRPVQRAACCPCQAGRGSANRRCCSSGLHPRDKQLRVLLSAAVGEGGRVGAVHARNAAAQLHWSRAVHSRGIAQPASPEASSWMQGRPACPAAAGPSCMLSERPVHRGAPERKGGVGWSAEPWVAGLHKHRLQAADGAPGGRHRSRQGVAVLRGQGAASQLLQPRAANNHGARRGSRCCMGGSAHQPQRLQLRHAAEGGVLAVPACRQRPLKAHVAQHSAAPCQRWLRVSTARWAPR